MTLLRAKLLAKHYSNQYYSWYVREVTPGNFEPWAHDSEDHQTVAAYYSGVRGNTYQDELTGA